MKDKIEEGKEKLGDLVSSKQEDEDQHSYVLAK